MVTDQYSHILDENRKVNARLIEDAIYQKESAELIQYFVFSCNHRYKMIEYTSCCIRKVVTFEMSKKVGT